MNTLVWFRNDLRISDNQSLTMACKEDNVMGVFCLDPKSSCYWKLWFSENGEIQSKIPPGISTNPSGESEVS